MHLGNLLTSNGVITGRFFYNDAVKKKAGTMRALVSEAEMYMTLCVWYV